MERFNEKSYNEALKRLGYLNIAKQAIIPLLDLDSTGIYGLTRRQLESDEALLCAYCITQESMQIAEDSMRIAEDSMRIAEARQKTLHHEEDGFWCKSTGLQTSTRTCDFNVPIVNEQKKREQEDKDAIFAQCLVDAEFARKMSEQWNGKSF